jgi:hypothetical protein
MLAALEDDIDYCIEVLKIDKHDDKVKTKIKKLYAQILPSLAYFTNV